MPKHVIPICCVLVLLSTVAAHAQDKGRVGLTMGFPASVGLIWHVTDRVAIRPDFSGSHNASETTSRPSSPSPPLVETSSSTDGWNMGVGLSALWYLRTWDQPSDLRLTAGELHPSDVAHRHNQYGERRPAHHQQQFEGASNTYGVSGSFGAQSSIGTRLSVFGEVGFGYTTARNTSTFSTSRNETSSTTVGTRAGVGVAFYF